MSDRSANFDRAAAFMRDLAEIISFELQTRLGLPKERGAELGMNCSEKVCEEFSGQMVYVPMGLSIRISERDQAMYAEYLRTRRDITATAKAFDVCVQTAYKRIRMVEASAYAERQGGLF